jgi:hypothetical protein
VSSDAEVFRGIPGLRPPRPPIVLMTVWRPGAKDASPAPPMPGDKYGDDPRLGFAPVTP